MPLSSLGDLIKRKTTSNGGQNGSPGQPDSTPKRLFPFQRRQQQQQTPTASTPSRIKRSLPLEDIGEIEEPPNGDEVDSKPSLEEEVLGSKTSKLARSMPEVLADNSAMSYLVQYLEARDAVNLVKFLLDVRSFKASSSSSSNHGSFDSGVMSAEEKTTPVHSGPDEGLMKKDAVAIYHRFLAPDCPLPLHLGVEATHEVVQAICTEQGDVESGCFDPAVDCVMHILEEEYFREFILSDCYAKYQVDILTSSPVGMSDVLYNDTLLFHFMEFLEGEGDRDLIEFWITASHYREGSTTAQLEHLKEDALGIYERFISLQASTPLGFSKTLRSAVEESICDPNGIVSPACFDDALRLVIRVLRTKYLPRFLDSSLYRKFLQELLTQIQTSPYGKGSGNNNGSSTAGSSQGGARKKSSTRSGVFSGLRRTSSNTSLSTCSSSELSISTHNTLLAMSRSKSDHHGRSFMSEGMLDTTGENLWHRKQHSVVNIGQIDHLGRYKSAFEQPPEDPQAKTGVSKKVTQAMKRLVSSDMDDVKEELAWQMAEMIVKDITDVTSPPKLQQQQPSSDNNQEEVKT